MKQEIKEAMLIVLRKEEARLNDEYSHLSRAPEPLKKVQAAIRALGGYKVK